jgi:hypothetical protein
MVIMAVQIAYETQSESAQPVCTGTVALNHVHEWRY